MLRDGNDRQAFISPVCDRRFSDLRPRPDQPFPLRLKRYIKAVNCRRPSRCSRRFDGVEKARSRHRDKFNAHARVGLAGIRRGTAGSHQRTWATPATAESVRRTD